MKYFTLTELTASNTAKQRGIKNIPNDIQKANLIFLVENFADPLREAWGKPLIVTSGFRSRELNAAVGGSATSDHLNGLAIDVSAGSVAENQRLFRFIQERGFDFDQIKSYKNWGRIHLGYRRSGNRKQVFNQA